jgi:hypothetical protein
VQLPQVEYVQNIPEIQPQEGTAWHDEAQEPHGDGEEAQADIDGNSRLFAVGIPAAPNE